MEVMMRSDLPLAVFFDASCPMCHSEILNIKAHDTKGHLRLVDCSAPGFDDAALRNEGVTLADMMTRLHVRDRQGAWIKGAAAMELIYRTAGMQRMARLWESHAFLGRMYPWIARHRQALSLTGIPLLFALWRKWLVWRLYRKSQACNNGKCTL
jgi:predicted DCC family thiol-disulfide oxidoreductase YuxK